MTKLTKIINLLAAILSFAGIIAILGDYFKVWNKLRLLHRNRKHEYCCETEIPDFCDEDGDLPF